jgi:hypothetical protein
MCRSFVWEQKINNKISIKEKGPIMGPLQFFTMMILIMIGEFTLMIKFPDIGMIATVVHQVLGL